MKKIVILLIKGYQKTFSPDHGPLRGIFGPHLGCRFFPTCSQYGLEAVDKFGLGKGGLLAIKRISKCHPLNVGGYDPIPK